MQTSLSERGGEGEPDWETALQRLKGAYADGPLRHTAWEARRYALWCRARGHCAFPGAPAVIAELIDFYFERCTVRTVEVRLWHLRRVHRAMGFGDPTRSEEAKLAFRRGARSNGFRRFPSRSRQATPVNAVLRDRLLAQCPDTPMGLRDRALLWLGYDTLCRQAELVDLMVEDVEPLDDGTVRILVRASKSDPFRRGEYVYLTAEGYGHVRAWLEHAGLKSGRILRGVHPRARRNRQAMNVGLVRIRLRRLAAAAGLGAEQVRGLSGHSMRVGATHDLVAAGRTLPEIMRAGRWRSILSVAGYMREAPINVWAPRPSADLARPGPDLRPFQTGRAAEAAA